MKREKGRRHDHLSPLGAISLVMVENKQYFPARNLAKSSPKICFLAENEPKQKKEAWASTFIEIYLHNSGFGLCASLSLLLVLCLFYCCIFQFLLPLFAMGLPLLLLLLLVLRDRSSIGVSWCCPYRIGEKECGTEGDGNNTIQRRDSCFPKLKNI